MLKATFLIFLTIFCIRLVTSEEFCSKEEAECKVQKKNKSFRYLFYDVNSPEGFNLRRDVYMRFAVFAHLLHKSAQENLNSVKLVLPPWPNLYHWRLQDASYMQIPWSHFFDLSSLQSFAPVIEMHQFFGEIGVRYGAINIEEVYVLQHFEDMFKSGKFEDKMEIQKCNKEYFTTFYHYENLTSNNIRCLSFHGQASQLSKILQETNAKTILFDHAEIALHDRFGDKIYWQARRSMRFNKQLVSIADEFRKKYLNSTDEDDNTVMDSDWRKAEPIRDAIGGPYLAVHLRRRDFAWARSKDVPDIESAGKQIKTLLKKLHLKVVFVATDAPDDEYEELKHLLQPEYTTHKYTPSKAIKKKHNAGGVAIIDQIICSHARYFVGTHESTFSFRIQEEREILGFPMDTTFNRLCGNDDGGKCEGPSKWTIVY